MSLNLSTFKREVTKWFTQINGERRQRDYVGADMRDHIDLG